MKVKLNEPSEDRGVFSESPGSSSAIHGRLNYDPEAGITVDLAENPRGVHWFGQSSVPDIGTVFGQLLDGTLVTLTDCIITEASISSGGTAASPTHLHVNRALFGAHVPDLNGLQLTRYSLELSSLSNWACKRPATCGFIKEGSAMVGMDIKYRSPEQISVELKGRDVDLRIAHSVSAQSGTDSATLKWQAFLTLIGRQTAPLAEFEQIAWQLRHFLSLLIGHPISLREVSLTPPQTTGDSESPAPMQLLYRQVGRHDHPDIHQAMMLLPYESIKDDFATMVETWLTQGRQAVLATNVFFGTQTFEPATVDARFLAAAQAAESFHRSLETGVYMDPAEYESAIRELVNHLPQGIQGDHRQSLVNRLKFGNEFSLRKRLLDMLDRIPDNVRQTITSDAQRFISRVVDTRNYFTHYDQDGEANAFKGSDAYVASEKLQLLVAADMLRSVGVKDDRLMSVLNRGPIFRHWMAQSLPL